MSRVLELKSKYGSFDASTLNHAQKVELRNELKSFKAEELGGVEEHRTYIELLKLFRSSLIIDANLNGENYLELLKNLLSVDVYSSPLRFLFELIQNVDDCDYADLSCVELDIKTDFNNGQIILTYNEVGFTPFNVFAITGIAEASKNISSAKVEIGEKGIGFKSAFGVADKVLIQSGKFSFELHKNNFTIPEPRYEEYEEIKGTRLTLFVEPKTVKQIYTMFVNKYKDKEAILNQNPVLFLNKLTKLRVYFDNLRTLTFTVERGAAKPKDGLQVETDVHLAVDLFDCHGQFDKPVHQELVCTRYTKPISYNREMCVSRYGEKTTFADKKLFMHIVLPHPENTYGDNAIKTGAFYSFLPTLIKLSVPMACHVPFKLDPPREYIDPQKKNAWFTHSYAEFAEMLKEVYIDYSRRVKQDIINYLPYKSKYLIESDVEKINCLKQDALKGETILSLPIFCSVNNRFLPVDKIFMFQLNSGIADPIIVYRLLDEPRELFLPDPRAKNNPGISTMSNVYEQLFKRALIHGTNTDAILQLLSGVESFSFEKMVADVRGKVFDAKIIKSISKHPKCLQAFQDDFIGQLMLRKRLPYQAAFAESDVQDVRFIEGGETGLEDSDFNINAKAYLKNIQYRCCYLSETPETFFFACDNVLFLSDEHRTASLSEFCERIDKNCMLALNLRFKNASNRLNAISSDMDAAEYLQLLRAIRLTIKSALGDAAYRRYINLINDAGIDSERYINELLQNADDCKYAVGVEPTFKLTISEDNTKIITSYNEIGFTHQNVRAITSIGESTKKQLLSSDGKIEIGEKGIGFKSVFAVASKVYIHSGNFRFMLADKSPTVPVLPTDETTHYRGTRMQFNLKEPIKSNFFTEAKVLRLCLCLRNLKHIKLGAFDVRIFDDGSIRKISINDKVYEYKIITHHFKLPNNLVLLEKEKQQREISSQQRIICYVHPGKEANNCYLYAGLPTRVKLNVPLVIDAPFSLTTSRDHLLDNQWNKCVREQVYAAIKLTIETLAKTEGISVLRFLHVKREGLNYMLDIFSDDMLNEFDFLTTIRKSPILQTYRDGVLASPAEVRMVRIPDVLAYCLENHCEVGLAPVNIIKIKEKSTYEGQAGALGLKFINPHNALFAISKVCDELVHNDAFRTMLYAYLSDNVQLLKDEQRILRAMEIVPVFGKAKDEGVQYFSFNDISDNLHVKPNCTVSPANCYILATHLMDKKLCEGIFGVVINELTAQLERANYRENLIELIDSMPAKQLYAYLLNELKTNRKMLDNCRDALVSRLSEIPLKNEQGDIKCGGIYVSNEPMGYFFGSVLPKHIAHPECKELAVYIGCKQITDVHYDDLTITDYLTDEDIEVFQDEYMRNGFEILEHCIRDGWIPEEYLSEVEHLKPDEIGYDESILNQPINRTVFERHMRQILSNRIRIEKRRVERLVSYCVPQNGGKEFLYDSDEARFEALHRYETGPKSGYCVCQMCKKATDIKYMEVNSVLKSPKYHWTECGVSLCLMCSKRFEELRGNESVRKRFYNDIKRANVYVNNPITLKIGTNDIVFGQKHLAEIQEILKAEE